MLMTSVMSKIYGCSRGTQGGLKWLKKTSWRRWELSSVLKESGIKTHTEKVEIYEKELVQRHANTNRLTQREGVVPGTEGPKPYKFIRDQNLSPSHSFMGGGEGSRWENVNLLLLEETWLANALNNACYTPLQYLVGLRGSSSQNLTWGLRILRRHGSCSGTFKKDSASHFRVDIEFPCLPDYNAQV